MKYLLLTLIIIFCGLSFIPRVFIIKPEPQIEFIRIYSDNEDLEIQVRDWAEQAGCDPDLMAHLAFLESQMQPNLKIKDSNKYFSYGLFMFQKETFWRQANYYKILGKTLKYDEVNQYIFDPKLQTELACRMIQDEKYNHWVNSFKKIWLIK